MAITPRILNTGNYIGGGRRYGQGYSGRLYNDKGYIVGDYSDSYVPTSEVGFVSVAVGNDPENAGVFYTGPSSNNYDWCDSQKENLWNVGTEEEPIKTDYDPCPAGWRVPTFSELERLSRNHSEWTADERGEPGFWFSGSRSYAGYVPQVFLPAAGSRYSDYDTYGRNYQGSYFSSTVQSEKYILDLGFTMNSAGKSGYFRASGYSVRSVQE